MLFLVRTRTFQGQLMPDEIRRYPGPRVTTIHPKVAQEDETSLGMAWSEVLTHKE